MKKTLGYEIFMTALVLVVIAGIAGALLGLVNSFTKVDPEQLFTRKAVVVYDGELERYKEPGGISEDLQYDHGDVLGVYVPKGENEKGTYVILAEGEGAYKGTLQILVNITEGKIVKIAKYEANETPGLGSKALQDDYFLQYYGKDITSEFPGFQLVKGAVDTDNDVKAISGASKSSTAVKNAVNAAVKWYKTRVLRGAEK